MAGRLAYYTVQQGYPAGEVTILTPYVGQLRLIRQAVASRMDVIVSDTDADQLARRVGSVLACPLAYLLTRLLACSLACS